MFRGSYAELIPQVLDMVDAGKIAIRPAVELSYLPRSSSRPLLTPNPGGKLYSFVPQYSEDDEKFKQFIEMCFDPLSPMNGKLKQTLIDMVTKGGETT